MSGDWRSGTWVRYIALEDVAGLRTTLRNLLTATERKVRATPGEYRVVVQLAPMTQAEYRAWVAAQPRPASHTDRDVFVDAAAAICEGLQMAAEDARLGVDPL